MDKPPFVKIAHLETQLIRGKISRSDYTREKWHILQLANRNREAVQPVTKDKRKKAIRDSVEIEYCYVPPSIFMYGSDNDYAESKAGFYISKYPITVKQFMTFLDNSDWYYSFDDLAAMKKVSPDDNCPVSHISWLDAKEFCRWLRRETNEYYSLPYELEWEYTARGFDGRPYPWGYNEPNSDIACFDGELVYKSTIPIGTFKGNKSPFGAMDMVGNLWEFCIDDFDDPKEPHCLRGGSWCHGLETANCTSRIFAYPPDKRVDYGGFRIIYLPGDVFHEYQKLNEPEEQSTPGLQVISHLPGSKKAKEREDEAKLKAEKKVKADTSQKPKGSLKKIARVLPSDADKKMKKRRK